MAKSEKQKQKLLYILKMLSEESDENHCLSTADLIEKLDDIGIKAERKSIYRDIDDLRDFGYEIELILGKNGGYYLASRDFELPELKVLVDAVLASKFITQKKSNELISKITRLAGKNEAKILKRQVYVLNRIKSENESIYYNVDDIHRAIQENRNICFRYLEYAVNKTIQYRRDGAVYEVSPIALIWNDENYYLIAYDQKSTMLKHYRVDKMKELSVSKSKRNLTQIEPGFDPAEYCSKTFGMFGGEACIISLEFPNHLAGVVIDRFGKEIEFRRKEKDLFTIRVMVSVSNQFFGWLTGLGEEVRITAPESVQKQYREYLETLIQKYSK